VVVRWRARACMRQQRTVRTTRLPHRCVAMELTSQQDRAEARFDVWSACKWTAATDAPTTCVQLQAGASWLAALGGARTVRQPSVFRYRPRAETAVGEHPTSAGVSASETPGGSSASAAATEASAPDVAQHAFLAGNTVVDGSASDLRAKCDRFRRSAQPPLAGCYARSWRPPALSSVLAAHGCRCSM